MHINYKMSADSRKIVN